MQHLLAQGEVVFALYWKPGGARFLVPEGAASSFLAESEGYQMRGGNSSALPSGLAELLSHKPESKEMTQTSTFAVVETLSKQASWAQLCSPSQASLGIVYLARV